MTQYVPIKTLCERTSLCEKTIRLLIRRHKLPHHRFSPRGKILVDVEAFEKYMRSTRRQIQKDPVVTEILQEFREFAQAAR
ncbi:MAG: helix-turn-helix domain-containing protein [Acidobacteria bacterium]|nr:helix-turn-helix domain-containing protein [Acidobacteriota bacterium]